MRKILIKLFKYFAMLVAAVILLLASAFLFIQYDTRNKNPHFLETMSRNSKIYPGYHPFTDRSLTKVCIFDSLTYLKNAGIAYDDDFYGYNAIVEFRKDKIDIGFVHENRITNLKPWSVKDPDCTDRPDLLHMKRYDGAWLIEMEK